MKKHLSAFLSLAVFLFLFAACESSSSNVNDSDGTASDALIDEDLFTDDLVDEDEPVITDTKTDADLPADKDGIKDDGAASDEDIVPPVDEDEPIADETVTDDVTTDDVATDDVTTDDVTTDNVTTDDVATDDVATDDVATDDVATDDVATDDVTTDDVTTDELPVDNTPDDDPLTGPAEMVVSQNDTVYPNNGAVFDFGGARIAVDTPTYEFLIENIGGEDLHIDAITLDDTENFILDISSTDTTVAPGGFTTVSITFEPTLEGSLSSFVTIESDDPAGDYILNIGGTGLPTPVFPLLLDNYDGTGDLTYANDGVWSIAGGVYESYANGLTTPEHNYASYDLTQSIPDWTLDKARGNEWFGWLKMNRTLNVDGWSTDHFSMAMVLAADDADLNASTTQGYAAGFRNDGALVVFRFNAGINNANDVLPGNSTEIVNSGYICTGSKDADGGVNLYVELGSDGKWTIRYKHGVQLSDADARDKMKYTGGTVTSTNADETYTGNAYKYAGWAHAHKASADHKAFTDNFGAGLTK